MNRTGFVPGDSPRPAGGRSCFRRRARPPRPSEPILIPKLRIQFADFPYLHYSIDQRLFTLETCCGYGYEPARVRRHLPGIFKVRPVARGCRENFGTLRPRAKTHSLCETIRGPRRLMQKRQLFPELRPASPGRVALPRQIEDPNRFRCRVPEYEPDSLSALLRHVVTTERSIRRTLNQGFPQALGSTDPCSTAVHTEPFSTSALQESLWSICYYHQDLHPGRLQPGSHPKAFRATPATFLLVGASGRPKRACSAPTARYEWGALASSIFRASCFGR